MDLASTQPRLSMRPGRARSFPGDKTTRTKDMLESPHQHKLTLLGISADADFAHQLSTSVPPSSRREEIVNVVDQVQQVLSDPECSLGMTPHPKEESSSSNPKVTKQPNENEAMVATTADPILSSSMEAYFTALFLEKGLSPEDRSVIVTLEQDHHMAPPASRLRGGRKRSSSVSELSSFSPRSQDSWLVSNVLQRTSGLGMNAPPASPGRPRKCRWGTGCDPDESPSVVNSRKTLLPPPALPAVEDSRPLLPSRSPSVNTNSKNKIAALPAVPPPPSSSVASHDAVVLLPSEKNASPALPSRSSSANAAA